MSPVLSVHESAEIEINEAVDFYEMECRGLGSVFIDTIESAIESIVQFPAASQVLRGRGFFTNSRIRFVQMKSEFWRWRTRKNVLSIGVAAGEGEQKGCPLPISFKNFSC
jgi:hypothetical protein